MAAYEAAGQAIVYIDESGFAQDAPRTHGYAPAGQRCHGTHDWHAPSRINAIGALIGKLLLTSACLHSISMRMCFTNGRCRTCCLNYRHMPSL
ncbi:MULTISPECIES: hypothetical protein [Nitrosomonas]|uniref:hypothetical protein n=1 Tax=Nitrosomonas TaxID=914 RepID=UPI000A8F83D0|nr:MULTISPECIES: hypothetical protein [Nitrosomonas]UVS60296.1 transposase [Nitrosomonas sp. PLL12]